jgi:hypothetical protein
MSDMTHGPRFRTSGIRRRCRAAIVGALVPLTAMAALTACSSGEPAPARSGSTVVAKAADKLYAVLENAAQQERLGLAMYRATFANKADAEANTNIGTQLSSVAELDTTARDFRSVYAENVVAGPTFDIGRCVGKDTYNDNFKSGEARPTTLAEANEALKTRVYKITQKLTFIPCPGLGIIPNGGPDLAVSRLSDGVFPVTLSPQQAHEWAGKVRAANLFEVTDEGMVEHDGKQVRKLGLTPRGDGVNRQLFEIFYGAAEIDAVKREHPDAGWEFGFIAVNPRNTGSVGGYYLIDEQANLPVYSELYGTNPDKGAPSGSAARNIARTKQRYYFPAQLSITPKTPLEFVE